MRPPRLLVAWAWTALIFVLCWTPRAFVPGEHGASRPFPIPYFDKFVHFALFAGFSFWWMVAGTLRARWVVALGLLAALASELGQLAPAVNRDANWPDGLADSLGLLAGLVAYRWASRRFPAFAPPGPGAVDRLA